jgi:hypothetical protein
VQQLTYTWCCRNTLILRGGRSCWADQLPTLVSLREVGDSMMVPECDIGHQRVGWGLEISTSNLALLVWGVWVFMGHGWDGLFAWGSALYQNVSIFHQHSHDLLNQHMKSLFSARQSWLTQPECEICMDLLRTWAVKTSSVSVPVMTSSPLLFELTCRDTPSNPTR